MKAAVIYKGGNPDILQYEDVPDPTYGDAEVLISTKAISIEGGDVLARSRNPASTPFVIGYCAAGEVIGVGACVDHVKLGDRIATFGFAGSHAERRAVRGEHCWVLPANLDMEQGVAAPVTFGTAHDCLFEYGHLQHGETVLIQGGTGAVGIAAIQLANRAGARVIAVGRSDRRLAMLEGFGVDAVINQRNSDLVAEVMALTSGRGVDLAIDPIGGSHLQMSLGSLGQRGRLVTLGRAAREPMILDISTLGRKQQSVTGVLFGLDIGTERVRSIVNRLLMDVASGELKSIVERTFPLAEAIEAHAYVESEDRGIGRVVMAP